jgi:HEAT repeat protein
MKKIVPILMLLAAFGLSAKDKKENIADLKSADDAVAIKAAQELGADGTKDAIEPLGEVVKSNRSAGVRIAAASALGRMDTKGRPTTILREAIEADQDNQVLYTELLAILNLKDTENPDLAKALDYCEANKKSDIYIADIVTRIRKVLPKKEGAPAPAEVKPAPAAGTDKPADAPK